MLPKLQLKRKDLTHLQTFIMNNYNYNVLIISMLLLWGVKTLNSYAGVADPPLLSTADNPTYYVIMNVSFGTYLRYEGNNHDRIRLRSLSEMTDASLWYFTSANGSTRAQDGVNFVAKSIMDVCLNHNIYLTHLAYFEGQGDNTIWYIHKSPFDNAGCVISYTAGHPTTGTTNCWHYDKMTFLNDGHIKLDNLENQDDYKYVFYSYQDLLDLAESIGMDTSTYESADRTKGASFQTLINAITNYESGTTTIPPTTGSYLLRNRRTGLFLNTDGTLLTGVAVPTQYSVWKIENDGETWTLISMNGEGTSIRLITGQERAWDINPTHDQTYNPTFAKSSDGNPRFMKMQYKEGNTTYSFSMHTTGHYIYRTTSGGITSDWELIPVTINTTTGEISYTSDTNDYEAYKSIATQDELIPENEDPTKVKFFRIMNATRSVASYDEDRFSGGGWLEDVDKMHFTYRKEEGGVTDDVFKNPEAFEWDDIEAMLMYSAKDVPFYAAEPNMSHASALWQFILVGRESANEENATGLISPEHNIFILRNVNTGAYIKNTLGVLSADSRSFLNTTYTDSEALRFYLTKLADGQWAINVYSGTSAGHDTANGCLYIDGESDGYRAGLTWSATETPARDSKSAWIISEAPTLELQMLVRNLVQEGTSNNHLYDWTTFYYPFDVTLSSQNPDGQIVNMFTGEWGSTYDYNDGSGLKGGNIKMTEINGGIPAGNAVFIRSTKNNGDSYTKVILDVWPANSGHVTTDLSAFDSNVWKGIVESGDEINGVNYFGNNWRNYWVLSRNSNNYLRLLHPSSDYLLPNRAYLDALKVANAARINTFNLIFDEPTYIQGIKSSDDTPPTAYNLQGQRVSGTLARGLMIVNGKKVVIK